MAKSEAIHNPRMKCLLFAVVQWQMHLRVSHIFEINDASFCRVNCPTIWWPSCKVSNEKLHYCCEKRELAATDKNKKAHQLVGQCETLCEVASCSSFRDFPKLLFCDGEVGDGRGRVNAICSQPEVADDVISCEDAETSRHICINLCFASLSSWRENRNKSLV